MDTKNISYQNKNIFYRITGNGPVVILLHGFSEDGQVWQQQVDFLKNKFRLIVPDIPGSGASAFNENLNTIDEYAEAIKFLLDSEGISKCIIIGHSMGGYITLALAEKHPHLFKAFGLFHSTAFPDTEEKKQSRLKSIEFISNNGAYPFIKTSVPGLFSEEYKSNHPETVESMIERGKNFSSEALIQYYRAMITRPDRTTVLRNTSNPVLFISGEKDNAVPLQSSLQQMYLPALSYIHILHDSAHMGMYEEADKANKILLNFLETVQ